MKSSQYVSLFLDEAQLLLEQAQCSLDQFPTTQAPQALQQELFRILHTLKGMASTLVEYPYFEEFTHISHALESLLDLNKLSLDIQNALQEGISALQTLSQNISHPQLQLPLETAVLLQKLETFLPAVTPIYLDTPQTRTSDTGIQIGADIQKEINQFQNEGKHIYWLHIELMTACLMKSVRAMLVLHNLKEDTVTLLSEPTLNHIQQGDFAQKFSVLVASTKTDQYLKEVAESVSEIESVSVSLYSPSPQQEAAKLPQEPFQLNEFETRIVEEAKKQSFQAVWLRFEITRPLPFLAARIALAFRALEENGEIIKTIPDVSALEAENVNQSFEILMVTSQDAATIRHRLIQEKEIELSFQIKVRSYLSELIPEEKKEEPPAKAVLKASLHFPNSDHTDTLPQFIRVDKKALQQLKMLTAQILQITSPDALHPSLIKALYKTHFDLYFIPASQLFKRYSLIIKELERALNKQITLTFTGEDTWLPRSMADPLSNILLHLVRNAADHGLELPDKREALSKPLTGKIHLSAELKQQQLCIEVKDDGAGIDLEKLKHNALKKNLFTPESLEKLSDKDALELVFSPGLSTANQTTQVSGRGVGMDTVRTHIEQLHGSIHLESTPDKGSCFQLNLPTSLSHCEVVIFEDNSHYFGIPIEQFKAACFVSEASTESLFNIRHWQWQTREKLSHDVCLTFTSKQKSVHIQAKKLLGIERVLFEELKTPTESVMIQAVGVSASQHMVKKLNIDALP